ncbi:hydrolase [Pseudorhizobium endolithicum]|uniref:Hydrolase n=1 Tax=Pseudorhizobium endolithicum TaxID=1191678 RepID=A0ABM8PQZ4_9HYPH|nr:alpha/beta fold hydrolase [Pseudorhizobium endolithicum]CAD7043711.1 hydrolase [Pseudorhizobium endolithicum]
MDGPDVSHLASLESDRSNIWLSPLARVASDVMTFEELLAAHRFAEAEPLYTQDFLQGFHLDEASDLQEWIFFRREALRGRLLQALERLVHDAFGQGRYADAARFGARLVECDPLNEAAHRYLIRAAMEGGDLVSARRHYQFCADLLQRSLGVQPSGETRALLQPASTPAFDKASLLVSPVRYVPVDGLHVAYRTVGEGEVDILLVPGFVSHVERGFDDRHCRQWMEQVASCGRLILFDRRGVGLSDRAAAYPTPEAVARDMEAVLDAAASRKAVVVGASEGGPGSIFFAVKFPQRVHSLILWGAMAKGCRSADYPFALDRLQFDAWLAKLTHEWGGPVDLSTFAPSLLGDPAARNWWASLLRASSSPGSMRTVLTALRDVDVRQCLSELTVRTTLMHRKGDRAVKKEASIYMAEQIPDARLILLEGSDHWFWVGDREPLIREIAAATAKA